MPVHVMVDLETFGVGNEAAPISIGAVKFDQHTILDRFHVGIHPESCEQRKLTISASTVLWWLDDARRDAWHAWLALEKVELWHALEGFTQWCLSGNPIPTALAPGEQPDNEIVLWGNGATFDNVILSSAYAGCDMNYPVEHWNDRCYRTVKNLMPELKLTRVGVHHSAVDDAESQARHLQQLAVALGFVL